MGVSAMDGSIIFDRKTKAYHYIFTPGVGDFTVISTLDFRNFTVSKKPFYNGTEGLVDSIGYPTVIGTHGDAMTADGTATVYFGGNNLTAVPLGRPIYSMGIAF